METPDARFDPEVIHAIFKLVWSKRSGERNAEVDSEEGVGASKRNRPTTEAVQRSAAIVEAEGGSKIEATHLERTLPQLLLDF